MKEGVMKVVFLLAACMSILAVALICIFLFANGVPAIHKIGITEFLFGQTWKPSNNIYGIFPMIIGSIYVTAGAVIIGVPMGILCAIFLARFCPDKLYKIVKPAVSLLAGIPSIVYGLFGYLFFNIFLEWSYTILGGALTLAIMILPTVINISVSSIRAVPGHLKSASLALGATHIQTIFKVMIPAARSGIMTGVVLGIGRALGEAMAINLVAGGSVNLPLPFNSVRFLTTQIVSEMSYAEGLHREVLFTVGLVLFIFIMIINLVLAQVEKKGAVEK